MLSENTWFEVRKRTGFTVRRLRRDRAFSWFVSVSTVNATRASASTNIFITSFMVSFLARRTDSDQCFQKDTDHHFFHRYWQGQVRCLHPTYQQFFFFLSLR